MKNNHALDFVIRMELLQGDIDELQKQRQDCCQELAALCKHAPGDKIEIINPATQTGRMMCVEDVYVSQRRVSQGQNKRPIVENKLCIYGRVLKQDGEPGRRIAVNCYPINDDGTCEVF